MRKTTGIVVAAAFLLTLSACAAAPGTIQTTSGPCKPIWTSGALADSVTPSGDFDALPLTATFPLPLVSAEQTSTSVVSVGSGAVVQPDDIVDASLTLFDASTGDEMTSGKTTLGLAGAVPLFDAAACATVGSRVVAIGAAGTLVGPDYVSQWGIAPSMTVVSVLDIDGAYPSRASGSPVPPQPGMPTVSHDATGRPGLSFTGAPPPADLRIETLIQGSGATVQDGDYVLVNYTGVDWDTKTVFDSSWQRGAPAAFVTSQVVPGFTKAIVGQKVGSEVLASIPPADGYGDNPPSGSNLTPSSTMVFVIDILGVLPAAEAAAAQAAQEQASQGQ